MGAAQVPIESLQAGVYQWTLVSSAQTLTGYVVVRGPSADPIGEHEYAQGTETWYLADTSSGGTATFELELMMMDDPDDQDLVGLVDELVEYSQEMGVMNMVPDWTEDPPLSANVQVYTLTSVSGGTGQYGTLYEQVSFALSTTNDVPTFYSATDTVYSIFGGSSQSVPIQEGITATFSPVGSNDKGYPDSSWYFYGRDF